MDEIGRFVRNYIKTGDSKYFDMLYQKVMPPIYRYYYFKTFDRQLSEDLTSEVFIKVYSNIGKTNLNGKSFMVWIYRIANNLLIDHYRKKNRNSEAPEAEIEKMHIHDEEIFKKNSSFLKKELGFNNLKLLAALNSLKGLQKDILVLRFVENMDYDIIAGIYNKKKGTIRGIVFRGIEKLRKELTDSNG